MRRLFYLLAIIGLFSACKKGEKLANEAPDTIISLREINLTGQDRLNSEVTLHWFGSDVDGYVTGYDISIDNGSTWSTVTNTDSTFIFTISAGSDTLDIQFQVRAIDDQGTVDPTPATLRIPIKNTPPVAAFDSLFPVNDTAYTVFTLFPNVQDPDGFESLDSIFIKINNGSWYPLAPDNCFLTLQPVNPEATGPIDAEIYFCTQTELLSNRINGLRLNDFNTVYIKAKDIAGSESPVDSSNTFYLKNKTSDLLVIDSYSADGPQSVYDSLITARYGNYDYIDIEVDGNRNLPPLWSPTFGFLMNLYDKVFWFADQGITQGDELYLETAAPVIQEYINQGGKIFITAPFPAGVEANSPLFTFTPMDSMSSASSGQARIGRDSLVYPVGNFVNTYPELRGSATVSGVSPFYAKSSADVLYRANLRIIGAWFGPDVVGARLTNLSGNTNMVFFSIELHKILGNLPGMADLFNEVLNNEFNW